MRVVGIALLVAFAPGALAHHSPAMFDPTKTVTIEGTVERYEWANPAYDLAHASMVPCLANLLAGLCGEAPAETTAADNLRTLQLVFAAYESARTGQTVAIHPYTDT